MYDTTTINNNVWEDVGPFDGVANVSRAFDEGAHSDPESTIKIHQIDLDEVSIRPMGAYAGAEILSLYDRDLKGIKAYLKHWELPNDRDDLVDIFQDEFDGRQTGHIDMGIYEGDQIIGFIQIIRSEDYLGPVLRMSPYITPDKRAKHTKDDMTGVSLMEKCYRTIAAACEKFYDQPLNAGITAASNVGMQKLFEAAGLERNDTGEIYAIPSAIKGQRCFTYSRKPV